MGGYIQNGQHTCEHEENQIDQTWSLNLYKKVNT